VLLPWLEDGVLLDGVELEGVSVLEHPARIAITMQRHRTTARIFFIVYLQKIFALLSFLF
jgi:hypothetical protein